MTLAELGPDSLEVLKHVARFAPIPASEVTDRFQPEIVQSLVDRRLIVQVGDRLDTYWDTFRDYLNTGQIPLEDSYILRSAPNQIARMLPLVMRSGGQATVADLVSDLGTSENVIFNLSRDSRLLGVTVFESLKVRMANDVYGAADPEVAARDKVTNALRRHRAYSVLQEVAAKNNNVATADNFSQVLARVFPAVSVSEGTWKIYARVFFTWFEYAGLASRQGNVWRLQSESGGSITQRLLTQPLKLRSRPGVPQSPPRQALELLRRIAMGEDVAIPEPRSPLRDYVRTLSALGLLSASPTGQLMIASRTSVDDQGKPVPAELHRLLRGVPGGAAGLDALQLKPTAGPMEVGTAIRSAIDATWTTESTYSIGGYFRAWARHAGVTVGTADRKRSRQMT